MLRVDASVAHRDKVAAWFRLSDEQRTYYNMKAGFRFEQNLKPSNAAYMASAAVRPEEKALFGGIPAIDWPRLHEGFGRKLASCYVEDHLRPNLNDRMAINADDRAELTAIIDAIYKRI